MKYNKLFLILLLIAVASCSSVNSSELISTEARDLRLEASIREYLGVERAKVNAQLKTIDSHVAITFNSGETLEVNHGNEFNPNESVVLSNNQVLNLDHDYNASILKSPDGNYAITYTDKNNELTTVSVRGSLIPEFEILEVDRERSKIRIRWDPEGLEGRLRLTASWTIDDESGGIISTIIQNTGDYEFDYDDAIGHGHLSLSHITTYNNLPGFGESRVNFYNIDSKDFVFEAPRQVDPNNRMLIQDDFENTRGFVDDRLDQCLRSCEEEDVDIFWVDGVEYSCCE